MNREAQCGKKKKGSSTDGLEAADQILNVFGQNQRVHAAKYRTKSYLNLNGVKQDENFPMTKKKIQLKYN